MRDTKYQSFNGRSSTIDNRDNRDENNKDNEVMPPGNAQDLDSTWPLSPCHHYK